MTILKSRFLSEAECTFETKRFPIVLSPSLNQPFDAILDEISARRTELLEILHRNGAILLRNCNIENIRDFHRVLEVIEVLPAGNHEYYGEVIRNKIGSHGREVTLVGDDDVVIPHTEAYYWYRQPKYISFYCEQSDCEAGETPLFDCAGIMKSIPSDLLGKLKGAKVLMQYIYASESRTRASRQYPTVQLKNTWQRIFETRDKKEVERELDRDDVEFCWMNNDELLVKVVTDLISKHPATGQLCFRGVRYPSRSNHEYMLKEFIKPRLGDRTYGTLAALLFKFRSSDPRRYFWTDSIVDMELSKREENDLTEAYFKNCSIFRWKTGDMILIDNLKMAHARLNVDAHRKICIFIGEYFDQKKLFEQS